MLYVSDGEVRARQCANACSPTSSEVKVCGILMLQGYAPQQFGYKMSASSRPSHPYMEETPRAAFTFAEIAVQARALANEWLIVNSTDAKHSSASNREEQA